jgi:hypothetical protein
MDQIATVVGVNSLFLITVPEAGAGVATTGLTGVVTDATGLSTFVFTISRIFMSVCSIPFIFMFVFLYIPSGNSITLSSSKVVAEFTAFSKACCVP